MKRKVLFILGFALALLTVSLIVRHVWEQRVQHKREVAYRTAPPIIFGNLQTWDGAQGGRNPTEKQEAGLPANLGSH